MSGIPCPDCATEIYGPRCACGYVIPRAPKLPTHTSTGDLPLPEPAPRHQPTDEQRQAVRNAAKRVRSAADGWWTPERVVNDVQVAHIVRQAEHFGALSQSGRFLHDCIAAGRITADHKLGSGKPDPFGAAPAVDESPAPWDEEAEPVNW